jgi:hypothetical protein
MDHDDGVSAAVRRRFPAREAQTVVAASGPLAASK